MTTTQAPRVSVAILFRPELKQWGLRGDPYLWRAMRRHFKDIVCPATADELGAFIERAFTELTGYEIGHWDSIYSEKFAHGGLSSGHVSTEFWREKALPLLRARHPSAATAATSGARGRRRCPGCGSLRLAPILRGEPSSEVEPLGASGEVAFGGCMVFPDQPCFRCRDCEHEFGTSQADARAASRRISRLMDGR